MSKRSEEKWACEICTYENWPSSLKCTMCRTKKPLLGEDIYKLREERQEKNMLEIDTEGYLENGKNNRVSDNKWDGGMHGARAVTPEVVSGTTWPCSMCTFLNSENLLNCIQCDTPRSAKSSKNGTFNSDPEKTKVVYKNSIYARPESEVNIVRKLSKSNSQNLSFLSNADKISITKSNSQNILESKERSKMFKVNSSNRSPEGSGHCLDRSSPQNVIIQTESELIDSNILTETLEKSPNSRNNRNNQNQCKFNSLNEDVENVNYTTRNNCSISLNSHQSVRGQMSFTQKWSCPHCTYENWPKSVKCIMCGLGSNPYPVPPRNSPVDSPDCDSARGGCTPLVNDENYMTSVRRSNSRRFDSSENNSNPQQQSPNNCEYERRLRLSRQADWSWLDACIGVVEGDPNPVEAYLNSGGNPARFLTANEIAILNRPSAFDAGHTLVHLAIRFHREDMLATLLSQIEGSGSGVKRVPSYVAPDLAADIRRHINSTLRQRKGSFPCYFVTESATFALPAEVEDLSTPIQDQLFEELLDKEVQSQLESDPPVLNWSLEITVRLGSRLYALWNRSAGDCLLDSAMQATWGVFDRENVLRRALADSLHQGGHLFYPRWKEYESSQASLLHFTMDETQYEEDWAGLLSLASQPGASLDQLHVFALSHILRRPIIVYGVKYVKSFRGETLGFARFEGVYLPLLWEPSFCIRSPLALGYTRGHFSALVPLEPYSRLDGSASLSASNNINDNSDHLQVTFLPLMDRDRKMLPVHFLTQNEIGREEYILRQWLDVCVTEGGITVAQQKLHKRPLLVAQMLEEWLNHYRRLEQMTQAPFSTRQIPVQDYSSEGETDDE
ncbi:hypothetical protein RUM44_002161 [Polyplax serrata]|uniref:ubiquitinyl hydrolase 1 n=1 Tax=Polyplax serrata TaxID=468196 RepID=A0ABR1AM30_POLSC